MIGWDSYLRSLFPDSPSNRTEQADRFIPSRSPMNIGFAQSLLSTTGKKGPSPPISPASSSPKELYQKMLEDVFLTDSDGKPHRMLRFQPSTGSMKKRTRFIDEMRHEDESPPSSKSVRCLPKSSDRILDAPNLMDDYYLNVLDWGSNNVLAVALGSTLYLWSADTGKVRVLMEVEEDHYLTSVAWGGDGNTISVGTSNSDIQIWDCKAQRKIRSLSGHMKRVGCLAWNGSLLTSGSGDSTIINRDVRSRSNIVSRLRAHAQEVCGLRWSGSGNQLASGGNDNLLHIWDASVMASSSQGYLHRLTEHRAAVKAIAWCPYQSNILASGGGTADRCIKMWNTQTGQCISSTDTQSQVCALEWNRHQKEILSSHGYSQNQLSLWRYPSMTKLGELKGHTSRVLYLSQSPDGTTVVSASADETLRFWKVFVPPQASKKLKEDDSPLSLKFSHIR